MGLGHAHATGHGHGSGHATRRSDAETARRLGLAAGLNVVIVVLQVVAGLAAGSVALLADAAHNLSDVGAVLLSLLALRLLRRPATPQRSFGWHRGGVLAAQANAAALVAVGALLGYGAVLRLGSADAVQVEAGVVLVAALLGAAVNAGAAWLVHDPAGDDLNVRGALLHLVSDALVSLAVAATGAVVLLSGPVPWLDPLVALGIALLVAGYGVALLRRTSEVLLEAAPHGLDVLALERDLLAVPGVRGVHDLHVWTVSDRLLAASGHLLVDGHPSLEDAMETTARAKEVLRLRYGVGHATLEAECDPCAPPDH